MANPKEDIRERISRLDAALRDALNELQALDILVEKTLGATGPTREVLSAGDQRDILRLAEWMNDSDPGARHPMNYTALLLGPDDDSVVAWRDFDTDPPDEGRLVHSDKGPGRYYEELYHTPAGRQHKRKFLRAGSTISEDLPRVWCELPTPPAPNSIAALVGSDALYDYLKGPRDLPNTFAAARTLLSSSFIWGDTPQGWDYWNEVHQALAKAAAAHESDWG